MTISRETVSGVWVLSQTAEVKANGCVEGSMCHPLRMPSGSPPHPWTTEVIFLKNYSFYFMCMTALPYVCMTGTCRNQKKALDHPELLMNMSYHMSAGNRTLVF